MAFRLSGKPALSPCLVLMGVSVAVSEIYLTSPFRFSSRFFFLMSVWVEIERFSPECISASADAYEDLGLKMCHHEEVNWISRFARKKKSFNG